MKVLPRTQLLIALLLATTAAQAAGKAKTPDFGPNVAVFSPATPAAEIRAKIDKVYAVQQHNQFGSERNAFLFLPGEYKVDVPIGFYTEVLGLGAAPDATHITGNVRSEAASRNNNATTTFWKAIGGLLCHPGRRRDALGRVAGGLLPPYAHPGRHRPQPE